VLVRGAIVAPVHQGASTGAPATGRIPVFRSSLAPGAIERASSVMSSGWLGQGAEVRALEERLAKRLGARNCVAVSSGTATLHLALTVLDPPPGAEVLTTAMTWIATHHAIDYVGCRAVLADIDPGTGNVDPASVLERISDRTAALLVVHYAGYPADLRELRAVAEHHGLPLVEDAAQAVGATYAGVPIGGAANLQAFSFGPTKNLTTIHGGAVTTGDDDEAQRMRRLRSLGVGRGTSERALGSRGSSYRSGYDLPEVGFRYEMPDVHAAVGLGQLEVFDAEHEWRAQLAERYAEALAGVEGIVLPDRAGDRIGSNYFYPVFAERRDELAATLRERGIDVSVHYPLNPLVDSARVPKAKAFAERTLTLPLHPSLSDDQQETVIEAVRMGW
jgi:perosamine synthetase